MYKKLSNFRTVPPGVTNLVSKCAGNLKEKSHKVSRRELCALQSNRAKCRGGGPFRPPPVFLGLKLANHEWNLKFTAMRVNPTSVPATPSGNANSFYSLFLTGNGNSNTSQMLQQPPCVFWRWSRLGKVKRSASCWKPPVSQVSDVYCTNMPQRYVRNLEIQTLVITNVQHLLLGQLLQWEP